MGGDGGLVLVEHTAREATANDVVDQRIRAMKTRPGRLGVVDVASHVPRPIPHDADEALFGLHVATRAAMRRAFVRPFVDQGGRDLARISKHAASETRPAVHSDRHISLATVLDAPYAPAKAKGTVEGAEGWETYAPNADPSVPGKTETFDPN